MKKFLLLIIILLAIVFHNQTVQSAHYAENHAGYILLQVEEHGEAWYIYPQNGEKYFLGRPKDAFEIMKKLSLGAKHDYIANNETFPERLSGMILLDVETNGEAYYIYPEDLKKYYLGRPADAFKIMEDLGLGATNRYLTNIPTGDINKKPTSISNDKKIVLSVPFTSQAPFGNWDDQRQQDGCEESSALMAVKWAQGESLDRNEALEEILGSSDFTQEKYGEYRDVSSADTIDWIFKDYFDFDSVELKKDIEVEDIIHELENNRLVLTPMNGQIMHNPNFTPPGPPRHMIVIKGYDPETNKFITNDPGTRNGESYEYDAHVLFDAIRDYPTGYHEKITSIEKNMIVVSKQ